MTTTRQELLDGVQGVLFTAVGPVQVPVPGQLEQPRIPDLPCEVLTAFERNDVVAAAMHDERRSVHGRERASHIHLTVAAKDLAHQVRCGRGPFVAGEKRGRVGIGRHVCDEETNGLAGVPPRYDTVDERLDDGRLDAPAFHRNHEPIWSVLAPFLLDHAGDVLEIGSGTGQHVVAFAGKSPDIVWWPSD